MNYKKIILIFAGIIYLIFALSFSFGMFYCLHKLPGDPDDIQLLYFGFGLCSLPAIVFCGGAVGFYLDLHREIISLDQEKNCASADARSGNFQP